MSIKKLQHGFTNPKQSKMLLEFGVMADSADMYYKQYSEAVVWVGEVGDVPQGKTFYIHEPLLRHINPEGTWTWKDGERIDLSGKIDELRKTDIPCWSLGRLIEICKLCEPQKDYEQLCDEMKDCKDVMELTISHIKNNLQIMKFSKLEE